MIDEISKKVPAFRPAIYVDVDGTLINPDMTINMVLVDELRRIKVRHGHNVSIVVWSSSGQGHAMDVVRVAEMDDIVDVCLCKPFYIVDDLGEDLWHVNKITFIDDFPQKKSGVVFK